MNSQINTQATNVNTIPSMESIGGALTFMGVPRDTWKVSSSDEATGIVMVVPSFQSDDGTRVPLSVTRGTVWGEVNGRTQMLVSTLGYIPEYQGDTVSVTPNPFGGHDVVISDSTVPGSVPIVIHSVTPPQFDTYTEGLVVRMARVRGKDYILTHTKLDYSRTKWGRAVYKDIFERLGLPTHEQLFGNEVVTSPWTYYFIASVPEGITASRQVFEGNGGYLTYVGATHAWNVDPAAAPFAYSANDGTGREYAGPWDMTPRYIVPPVVFDDLQAVIESVQPVRGPVDIPSDKVTQFLRLGYQPEYPEDKVNDARVLPGECVILYANGSRYKIESPSFRWRNSLRNGNPSLKNQWNLIAAHKFTNWNDFNAKYIQMPMAPLANIREMLNNGEYFLFTEKVNYSDKQRKEIENNATEYRRLLFLNFIFSLPPADQKETIEFYDEYKREREHLVKFIHAWRSNKLFFVDPSTLSVVGVISTPFEKQDGHVYQKGALNMIYDVTNVVVPKGKSLVLLSEAHPRIAPLVEQAVKRANQTMGQRRNPGEHRHLINKNIHKLLDGERGNTYHQMTKQATAWGTTY